MDLDAQGPTSAGSGPKSADRRGADGPRLVVQIAASDLSDVLTDRGRVLKQRMALPVLVAALGVIPLLILEEWILPDSDSSWPAAANWAIWAAFTVETERRPQGLPHQVAVDHLVVDGETPPRPFGDGNPAALLLDGLGHQLVLHG